MYGIFQKDWQSIKFNWWFWRWFQTIFFFIKNFCFIYSAIDKKHWPITKRIDLLCLMIVLGMCRSRIALNKQYVSNPALVSYRCFYDWLINENFCKKKKNCLKSFQKSLIKFYSFMIFSTPYIEYIKIL